MCQTKEGRPASHHRYVNARVSTRVDSLQSFATGDASASWRRNTAPIGLESGSGLGHRHQPDDRVDDAYRSFTRMGFWTKSVCITNRFTSGGAIAHVAIRAVHRNRRAPVSHRPITTQPTANQASQTPPLAAVSRYLAVGVACACCVGSFGRDRDAFTCFLSATRNGLVHASPSKSPHASGSAVNHAKVALPLQGKVSLARRSLIFGSSYRTDRPLLNRGIYLFHCHDPRREVYAAR